MEKKHFIFELLTRAYFITVKTFDKILPSGVLDDRIFQSTRIFNGNETGNIYSITYFFQSDIFYAFYTIKKRGI